MATMTCDCAMCQADMSKLLQPRELTKRIVKAARERQTLSLIRYYRTASRLDDMRRRDFELAWGTGLIVFFCGLTVLLVALGSG